MTHLIFHFSSRLAHAILAIQLKRADLSPKGGFASSASTCIMKHIRIFVVLVTHHLFQEPQAI